MRRLIESGQIPMRGGLCIDLYNQAVYPEFVTITTRIDQCNHYWVTVD